MPTFDALLRDQLRRDAARPLVTFYDDTTGERVELSVTTYANWVAKTASLCAEELDLGRGSRILVDLPTHWLGPVWLGAAWTLGCEVVTRDPDEPDLVVCGPSGVAAYAAAGAPVVALSLRPLGGRFTEPLPSGVMDFGVEVFSQPDAFTAYDPPGDEDAAYDGLTLPAMLADLDPFPDGTRLLTDANPILRPATLLGPLRAGGGTVWAVNPDPDGWKRRATQERATVVQPARS